MKRIYMTAALLGTLATGAFAQKTVDLAVKLVSPATNSTYANFHNPPTANADTLIFAMEITNNGPSNVTASDTLTIGMGSAFLGLSTSATDAFQLGVPDGYTLASGQVDTLYFPVWNGRTLGSLGTVNLHSNLIDSAFIFIFGVDNTGADFIDAGVDIAAGTVGGNNFYRSSNIKIGTPGLGILDVNGKAKESLTTYPNPAGDVINFDYNFAKATTASVMVSDITGRVLLTKDFGKNVEGKKTFTLNLGSLNAGNYILEFVTDESRAISKFNKK